MRKEKECDLVKDLLLNYVDGVLTDTSKEFVEQHISGCPKCQERLQDIKKDL